MADTAVENEADSGCSQAPDGTSVPEDDPEVNDTERVTGSNTNYDSSDGNHRCDRCDFEAVNEAALTDHVAQAHSKVENETEMEV